MCLLQGIMNFKITNIIYETKAADLNNAMMLSVYDSVLLHSIRVEASLEAVFQCTCGTACFAKFLVSLTYCAISALLLNNFLAP